MKIKRVVIFISLLACIGALIGVLIVEKYQPPFARTFSPLFQLLGKPIKSVDRAVSELMPLSDEDERMLGEELKTKLNHFFVIKTHAKIEQAYLNELIKNLTSNTDKKFEYSIYLIWGYPNAFALPGGIVCITDQLLEILSSEAELVGILGHEIGHIERGHVFDAFRGKMLRRKIAAASIITSGGDIIRSFSKFCFSKAQEDEADEYGFRMLLEKEYNPLAMSTAFQKLLEDESELKGSSNIFKDFSPHTRISKYVEINFDFLQKIG